MILKQPQHRRSKRDLIVLYSDGITEAGVQKEQELGEARLVALIAANRDKPLAEIQQEVLASARERSGGEQEDDMTLLLVRVMGSCPPSASLSRRDYEN